MSDNEEKVFAIILDSSLNAGKALNAAAHMAAQLGALDNSIRGSTIFNKSGGKHLGLPIYGNVILSCSAEEIRLRLENAQKLVEAMEGDALIVDFPEEGFTTSSDRELVDELSGKLYSDIVYRGFLVFGPRSGVRKITKGLNLWK